MRILVVEDTDIPSKPDLAHPIATSPSPVLSPARQTNHLEEVFLLYSSLGFWVLPAMPPSSQKAKVK
jgi:hypothetical protein